MQQFVDWIRGYLARRSLDKPNGEMLFAYRTTRAEYLDLRTLFADKLKRLSGKPWEMPSHSECACFVLYAAEWWRREYAGGPWRWMDILESFGQPFDLEVSARTLAVQRGIKAWGQQTSSSGMRFLGAIVAQGGLPLEFVAKGDGSIARLLIGGLRQAQLYSWDATRLEAYFEAHATELVLHLREEDIYRLLASVVLTVVSLRQRHGLAGCANPVEVLDRNEPEWRLRFPISVEDKSAEPLLTGLVREAAKEIKSQASFPVVVTRSLLRSEDGAGFELSMMVEAPTTLALGTLAAICDIKDDDFPQSFALELVGNERLSLGTGRQLLGGNTPTVMLSVRTRRLQGDAAVAEQLLVLRGLGADFHDPVAIPGADALDEDLPWIFALRDGHAVLVGQGGCRVPDERCWIAINPSAMVSPADSDGTAVRLGRLHGLAERRDVYELQGTGLVDGEDGAFLIKTRQTAGLTEQLVWRGRRTPYCAQPFQVYQGLPRLYRTTPEGQQLPVMAADLIWCEARRGGERLVNPKAHRGPVDAWLLKDGQRLRRFRMALVGPEAHIRYQSGTTALEGTIEFYDWGMDALVAPDELQARTTAPTTPAGAYKLDLRAVETPPARVSVSAGWPRSSLSLRLALPFPAAGGRFALSGTGGRLGNGSLVSLRQLYSLRAQVFDHNPQAPHRYTLQVELQRPSAHAQGARSSYDHQLTIDATGQCELRLMELEATLLGLWCQSDELDTRLSLSLRQGAALCAQVYLTRYDAELRHVPTGVEVPESSFARLDAIAAAGMKLRAIPLLKANAVSVDLEQAASDGVPVGRWDTSVLPARDGPWLLHPAADSTLQLRAVLHIGSPLDQASLALCELGQAMSIANPPERLSAIATAVANMAQDLAHPSWVLIAGQHRELAHLPLNTLDYWRAIAHNSAACLAVALTCSTNTPLLMTRMRTELGVVWELTAPLVIDQALKNARIDWAKKLKSEIDDPVINHVVEPTFRALGQIDAVFGERVDHALWRAGFPKADRLRDFIGASSLPPGLLANMLWMGSESLIQRYLLRAKSDNHAWPSFRLTKDLLQTLQDAAPADANWLSEKVGSALLWMPQADPRAVQHKFDAANVPFLAGLLSQFTDTVPSWADEERIAKLRHLRNFDPFWFETAFRMGVCMAVGVQKSRLAATYAKAAASAPQIIPNNAPVPLASAEVRRFTSFPGGAQR